MAELTLAVLKLSIRTIVVVVVVAVGAMKKKRANVVVLVEVVMVLIVILATAAAWVSFNGGNLGKQHKLANLLPLAAIKETWPRRKMTMRPMERFSETIQKL